VKTRVPFAVKALGIFNILLGLRFIQFAVPCIFWVRNFTLLLYLVVAGAAITAGFGLFFLKKWAWGLVLAINVIALALNILALPVVLKEPRLILQVWAGWFYLAVILIYLFCRDTRTLFGIGAPRR
jgi:hypothetical protein